MRRLRSGEKVEDSKHGTQLLNELNARVSASSQVQSSVTQSAPAQRPPEDNIPPTLRTQKREVLIPGVGEKLYQIA